MMKLVQLESPFASTSCRIRDNNVAYARRCMLDSLSRGEAPFLSHLLYTQVLHDADPGDRAKGIQVGLAWAKHADVCAVYIDRGVSKGMRFGIGRANKNGVKVIYRSLTRWSVNGPNEAKIYLEHMTDLAARAGVNLEDIET